MLEEILIEHRNALVVIVVVLIWLIGAIYLSRHNAFCSAASEFREAFRETFMVLRNPASSNDPCRTYKLLIDSFQKHDCAVIRFKGALPFYRRRAFDRAWKTYSKHCASFDESWPDCQKMNHLSEYLSINRDEEQQARALALLRLNKLLSYAKVI